MMVIVIPLRAGSSLLGPLAANGVQLPLLSVQPYLRPQSDGYQAKFLCTKF